MISASLLVLSAIGGLALLAGGAWYGLRRRRPRSTRVMTPPAMPGLPFARDDRGLTGSQLPPGGSSRTDEPALRAVLSAGVPRTMFGYASWDGRTGVHARDFRRQAEEIASECNRLEVKLLDIVREREPLSGRALERPGLGYALEGIAAGDAEGLVVTELSRLTRSAAELGRVLQWFLERDARLVAIGQGLDTRHESGRLAARTIIEVSRWEHEWLVERTRNGMLAARRKGPPGVADYPQLKERIAQMRADGMTLEAIAGQLNREGTPTVRGGAKWRPSSVQVAAGYHRPPAGHRNGAHRNGTTPEPSKGTA
jgi:DNA invertase Pin-like site-specific DNA recombinase